MTGENMEKQFVKLMKTGKSQSEWVEQFVTLTLNEEFKNSFKQIDRFQKLSQKITHLLSTEIQTEIIKYGKSLLLKQEVEKMKS